MIYKISLITAAALAAVAIGVSNKLQGGVAEATTRLEESKKALEKAQVKEAESAQHLHDISEFYGASRFYDGDISEAKYKEIYDKTKAAYDAMLATGKELHETLELKMNEPISLDDAVKNEYSHTFRQQCWDAKHYPDSKIRDMEREVSSMNRECTYLQEDVNKLLKKQAQNEEGKKAPLTQGGNQTIVDVIAPPTKPPVAPPTTDPLTSERLERIVGMRMSFVDADSMNTRTLSEVFSDAVYQLGGHISYSLQDLISMYRDDASMYSPRAVKVKAVGVNKKENSVEIIMAFVYKGIKKKHTTDRSGYVLITYMVDDDGLIIGMNEEESDSEPKLSKGFTPYKYKGEDTALSQ